MQYHKRRIKRTLAVQLDAVDISRTASASSVIYEALRRAIIEGRIAAGAPLRQDEIARQFNASRIPVREALMRLEELGLVRTQRYKGSVVAGLSADEAAEIFDFRLLIEPEVMRHAVPRMTPSDLSAARGACEAFAASKDPMQWGDLNRALHAALYQPSALPYHLEMLGNAMDRIDRYLRAQLLMSDGMARASAEHAGILAACEAGDAPRAAELVHAHIAGARASFLEHLPGLVAGAAR